MRNSCFLSQNEKYLSKSKQMRLPFCFSSARIITEGGGGEICPGFPNEASPLPIPLRYNSPRPRSQQ